MKWINRPNQIFQPKKKNLGSYIYQDSHSVTLGFGTPKVKAIIDSIKADGINSGRFANGLVNLPKQ